MWNRPLKYLIATGVALVAVACQTTPTGRRQLQFFPNDQVAKMGQAAFAQMKQKTPPAGASDATTRYVTCVAQSLVNVVPKPEGGGNWDIQVFQDDQVNAFALPGGGIGVYTGILKAARTPAQLAAVIGHELGHVQAEHANARLSTQYATEAGLGLVAAITAAKDGNGQNAMALLGLGAQVGILLPFSRAQESEADVIGLQYMAKAGYDPNEAVTLWQNMQAVSGGAKTPTFLSTHPSGAQRIDYLKEQMPKAVAQYKQAQNHPTCQPPG